MRKVASRGDSQGPRIDFVPLDDIQGAKRNPKGHDLETIKASLRRFGFVAPAIEDAKTGRLVAGHGRVAALREMEGAGEDPPKRVPVGPSGRWKVPVIRGVAFKDEQEAEAYLVADNRLVELGGWEAKGLGEILDGLSKRDALAGVGYTQADVKALLQQLDQEQAPKDPDEIPVALEKTVTRPGDMWRLGEHRIVCGSATGLEAWVRMTVGQPKAAMVFTDPPYGVSYESASGKHKAIAGDELRGGDLVRKLLKPALQHAAGQVRDDAAFYIWHAWSTREDFAWAMKAAGLQERQYLVWVKASIVLGHADYQWAHEPCFYAAKDGHAPAFHGDRSQPTVWRVTGAPRGKDGAQATTVGAGLILADGEGGQLNLTAKMPKGKKVRTHRLEPGQAVLIGEGGPGSTIWEVSRETNPDHPTQKPVALARIAMENSSRPGEIVLDPFLGSGCTLMAAEVLGRVCYGIELEPRYVDLAVRRWAKLTGQAPQLLRGGKRVDDAGTRKALGL